MSEDDIKRRAMELEKDIENGWTGEPPLWTPLSKDLLQQWNKTKKEMHMDKQEWTAYLLWRDDAKYRGTLWQKRHKTHDLSSFFWWRWWTQPVAWSENPTEGAKRAVRMQWAIGNLENRVEAKLRSAWHKALYNQGKTGMLKLWLFAYLTANTLDYYSAALLHSVYGHE